MALDTWHVAEEIKKAAHRVGGGTWPITFLDADTGETYELSDVKASESEKRVYVMINLVEHP